MGPALLTEVGGVSDFVRHRIEVPMHLRVSLFGAYARSFANAPEPPMWSMDAEGYAMSVTRDSIRPFRDARENPQGSPIGTSIPDNMAYAVLKRR